MNCPNCKTPFVEEKAGKYFCVTCGWFDLVDKEWQGCKAPEPELEPSPQTKENPEPEPVPELTEPDPAAHEPDPAAHEPDPAAHEPDPAAHEPEPGSVKKYFGGLVTVTEVDE